jgi:hypothetical protein
MVPPALRLHDQQIEDGHHGDIVEKRRLGRNDRGEVEGRWDEYIDLDATRLVASPAGKAAVQYAMRCPAFSGLFEVIAIVRFYDYVFYILRVKFLPTFF